MLILNLSNNFKYPIKSGCLLRGSLGDKYPLEFQTLTRYLVITAPLDQAAD